MPPNKSLQVSAGQLLSQLALSGVGSLSPPAPPELKRYPAPLLIHWQTGAIGFVVEVATIARDETQAAVVKCGHVVARSAPR